MEGERERGERAREMEGEKEETGRGRGRGRDQTGNKINYHIFRHEMNLSDFLRFWNLFVYHANFTFNLHETLLDFVIIQ